MSCRMSGQDCSGRIDPSIPVKCPACGAIRKIPGKSVWKDGFRYPYHPSLEGEGQPRRHYEHVDGQWKVMEG